MENPKNRNQELDLLRGLCILYIVGYYHLFNYTNAFPQYLNIVTSRFAWVVLATFTFLSGYFIALKKSDLSKESLIDFFKNRLLRIYPLYLIALLIFCFFGKADWQTTVKSVFAVSMLIKPAPPTLWFVAMLLVYYVLSPLLIHQIKRGQVVSTLMTCFAAAVVLLIIHHFYNNLDVRILIYFPAFFLGIVTAIKGDGYLNRKIWLFAFLIGFFMSIVVIPKNEDLSRLISVLLLSTAPYFIFLFFKNTVKLPQKLYFPTTVLAYSSYCMYLFHRPIYRGATIIYFPESELLQVIYLLFIALPGIVLISYFIQKYHDLIIHSLTARLKRIS